MYTYYTPNPGPVLPLWTAAGCSSYKQAPALHKISYIKYQPGTVLRADDGHGDYNRSYERSYDDFDYADYSTDHRDNNFRNFEKKRSRHEKTKEQLIQDLLKRWD